MHTYTSKKEGEKARDWESGGTTTERKSKRRKERGRGKERGTRA